ncbi:U-box domain-containing protein 26-like [Humulus lupulus]|uniref:U-box domain-containing protein 26-like n=1 Tax=Humulus lupulus TaxID=3486 RepID=UPI002B4175EF|nr:U-box domain-containing protein 26-like [Humulus lupulus]
MKEAEMTVPHLFRCPITLELFKDPVTLSTGQTYDRSSIEKWLAAGNLTCPVTMQKLHDPTMVPNHTLRHLIDRWLQMGHQFDHEDLVIIDSVAAIKHSLESHDTTFETKLQLLENIRVLSQESSSRSCLIQLGFLPFLLELAFGRVEAKISEEYAKFVEQALLCVLKLLPFCELESLNILLQESKFESFLFLFKHGSSLVKMNICQLIETTSASSETNELRSMLGKKRELLHEMVQLVHQNCEASDAGIKALWTLLSSPELNQETLITEGVVDGLVSYISSSERRESKSFEPLAMAILEKLLALDSAKEALVSNPNGITTLVKKIFRVSNHEGSENAVGSLMAVCYGSLQAREEAIGDGVLTQLLLLLQSQCSGRTKTKARMLLRLLRSKWIEDPNHV